MDLLLDGHRVLVTASSRGIGLATARRFLTEGADVAIVARDQAALDKAAIELAADVSRLSTHRADLTDADQVDRLLDEVDARWGDLDGVVVNTGGPPIRPTLSTSLDDWAGGYDLLLRPAVQIGLRAGASMAERGRGSIIFITSTWVKQPKPGGVLSASFRSAVSAFAKHLSLELAGSGVRVNQVMPGATGTGRMQDIITANAERSGLSVDEELANMLADIPRGQWATPEEIADTVTFLASPRSAATTGVAVQVDGGAVRATL